VCDTTTGEAPYCSADGNCFPCQKDAACIVYAGLCPDTGTACVTALAIDCHIDPS